MLAFIRKHYILSGLGFLFLLGFIKTALNPNQAEQDAASVSAASSTTTPAYVDIDKGQRAGYFNVWVTDWLVVKDWYINEYTSIESRPDTRFVLVQVIYENADNEGRTIFSEGKLIVNEEGQELQYDKVEPVIADGYNVFMEPLNPRVRFDGIFVFPIPSSLNGDIFWQPDGGQRFKLGNLAEAKKPKNASKKKRR